MIGAWDSHGKLVAKFATPIPKGFADSFLNLGYTLGPVNETALLWADMSRDMRENLMQVPREKRRIQAVKDLTKEEV